MTELDTNRHVNIEAMVGPVAVAVGVPKTVARRVIKAFCKQLNQELAAGHGVTLREVGRFRIATVNSYWKRGLGQEKKVQKKYSRIYFTASDTIMRQLNKHLRG